MNATPSRIGKYRIIKEVGRGATAIVYLAESDDRPEPVAVKHVRFDDKVKDEANPFEIVRIIRAFDPCLACAIHLVTPKGSDIGRFRVL